MQRSVEEHEESFILSRARAARAPGFFNCTRFFYEETMFHQFNAATQSHAWKTNQPILLEVKQVTAFLSTLVVKGVKTTGNLGDLNI